MKQTVSIFQRILSIAIGLAALIVLAGLFVVGVVFLWYALIIGIIVYLVRIIYLSLKGKSTLPDTPTEEPPTMGKVVSGDFRRSKGRVIDHD